MIIVQSRDSLPFPSLRMQAEPTRTMAGKGAGAGKKFLPFKKALLYARALKLKSKREWRVWCKSEARDANIPSAPDKPTSTTGGKAMGTGLAPATVGGQDQQFLPFKKALLYARSLKLKSQRMEDWAKTGVRPANMPSTPHKPTSTTGGKAMGTGLAPATLLPRQAVPAVQEGAAVCTLPQAEKPKEWKTGPRLVSGLPTCPPPQMKSTSTTGGKGMGTGWAPATLAARPALPAVQEGAAVCTLPQAEKPKEWKTGPRLVSGLPTCPPPQTNLQARRVARLWALAWHRQPCWRQTSLPAVQEGAAVCTLPQAEKPERMEDWAKTGVRPANMPSSPDKSTSTTGGKAMGTGLAPATLVRKDQQFLPFKKALLYARSLKLKGQKEWRDWAKTGVRPANMPSTPDKPTSTTGGKAMGTGWAPATLPQRQAVPAVQEGAAVCTHPQAEKPERMEDWAKTGVRPANMPSTPDRIYKHDGWQGYGHWLGTGNVAAQRPAVPAVQEGAAVCTLPQAERQKEWRTGPRLVSGLPTCPPTQINLQARRVARVRALAGHRQRCCQRPAVPAVQEGAAVCTLPQAENQKDWRVWCKSRCTACQHALAPKRNLQARRVARLWALAGHWHSC